MEEAPLRRLHVDVKRNPDLSEHQQRLNSASLASTTGKCQLSNSATVNSAGLCRHFASQCEQIKSASVRARNLHVPVGRTRGVPLAASVLYPCRIPTHRWESSKVPHQQAKA